MNTKAILAIAALAAAVSTGARAEGDNVSQYATQFEGNRLRAEVQAEANRVAATRSTEPAGSRVAAAPSSNLDARVIRAQAAQAVRLGQISSGEASSM